MLRQDEEYKGFLIEDGKRINEVFPPLDPDWPLGMRYQITDLYLHDHTFYARTVAEAKRRIREIA